MRGIHWRSKRGQAIPITIIFIGVIAGAAAISVDVGRVYALRHQAHLATSAAALAAAQSVSNELNQAVEADPTVTPSISTVNVSSPEAAADAVYQQNIKTALPNSGLGGNPTVTIQPITENYLGTLSSTSPQYKALSPDVGMILVEVSASGSTPMYFGRAVGVPTAGVRETSAALVGVQNSLIKKALLPLAIPATGNSTPPTSSADNYSWEKNITVGTSYFVYRGSNGSHEPSLPAGTPSSAIPIKYHNFFGSGNDGILLYGSGSYVTIGSTVGTVSTVRAKRGSSEWNTLSNETPGQTIYLPVGNSDKDHSNITVVGFITATIIAGNGNTGANAGFSFTVTGMGGGLPTSQLTGLGSDPKYAPSFMYQLVSPPA